MADLAPIAARFGECAVAELLIARGADPIARDEANDATPLDWAWFLEQQGELHQEPPVFSPLPSRERGSGGEGLAGWNRNG